MAYTPRTTRPVSGNKYYITTGAGGWSSACLGSPTDSQCNVLANCVGYAYGRFNEIGNYGYCKYLVPVNAENFVEYAENQGLKVSQTPSLGACMCWRKGATLDGGDGAGHVAIVEKIYDNNHIMTSESGYDCTPCFWTQDRYKGSDGNWGMSSAYHFRGFIVNPAVKAGPSASAFVNEAIKHEGEDGTWTYNQIGQGTGYQWCAAFVCAVAKQVGALNVVIPLTLVAGEIANIGVSNKMGSWLDGPGKGKSSIPEVGDCLLLTPTIIPYNYYTARHVEIVISVNKTNNTFRSISGNSTGGKVCIKTWNFTDSNILGFYRPNWGDGSGSISGGGYGTGSPLYTTKSTREDASVREIAYISKDAKPSIQSKDIRLSVINYTGALNAVYEAFGGGSSSGSASGDGEVDFSGIGNANAKVIGNYLIGKGLNAAQTVGFLANIYHESGYSPSAVNSSSGASGICQWLGGRYTAMVTRVGSNWKTNLSGQLDYLWYELEHSESATLTKLKSKITSNSESMAMEAARIVCDTFERPGDGYAEERATTAKSIWSKIKITSSDSGNVTLTGSTNEAKIWNFLRSRNYSKEATAAVMGNMYEESRFDPAAYTSNDSGMGPGGGLCGWLECYFGQMWKKSLTEQLVYVVEHFIPEQIKMWDPNRSLTSFTQTTDVSWAARYMGETIERGAGSQARIDSAWRIYNKYK